VAVRVLASALALFLLPVLGAADEPPLVTHQPVVCTLPEKPLSLCAEISDDGTVARARLYFRKAGRDYYAFVDMAFTGVSYCATLPAPRAKTKAVEYYVQAVDDAYQPARSSTFQVQVRTDCEFPPIEQDPEKAAAIKVFATHKKQGKKLDKAFVPAGVTFVPIGP
jgi:hypothetical protein